MTEGRVDEPVFDEWGWKFHEKAQRRRNARMSLAAKIAWLEKAQQMVLIMEQQRSTVRDPVANYDSKD